MLQIRKPDDFHLHLRQGEALEHYLGDTTRSFARALIMPNTVPPVNNAKTLSEYRDSVIQAMETLGSTVGADGFQPLFTFKLSKEIDGNEFRALLEGGVTAGKYYPAGATTNSEDGVVDHRDIFPLLEMMQAADIPLCIHGEVPDAFVLDREAAFFPVLKEIRNAFPSLRIVLEHITTKEGIETVKNLGGKTAGTITVHHLMSNLDDLLGGFLNPHMFCKPVLKRPEDQRALMEAAFSQDARFFLGTDSAPHTKENKECSCGCAGVYSAPVAIPALFQFFLEHGACTENDISAFQAFTAEHGARFYGLPLNQTTVTLEKREWTVPDMYHGVVPYFAGQKLQWRLV